MTPLDEDISLEMLIFDTVPLFQLRISTPFATLSVADAAKLRILALQKPFSYYTRGHTGQYYRISTKDNFLANRMSRFGRYKDLLLRVLVIRFCHFENNAQVFKSSQCYYVEATLHNNWMVMVVMGCNQYARRVLSRVHDVGSEL